MNFTRRDLSFLLPALAATRGAAQTGTLPSKAFSYEDLPVKTNGSNASRAILNGKLHDGFKLECHETELGPGKAPHPPHRHVHEELMYLREGTLEVTILGHVTTLGPGSVAFLASNEEHGWRNIGSTPARYLVIALGQD